MNSVCYYSRNGAGDTITLGGAGTQIYASTFYLLQKYHSCSTQCFLLLKQQLKKQQQQQLTWCSIKTQNHAGKRFNNPESPALFLTLKTFIL